MRLIDRMLGARAADSAREGTLTMDDYAELFNSFTFNGLSYGLGTGIGGIQQTLAGQTTERAANNFVGLAQGAYAANGVVFSCMLVRQLLFSSVRFRWQRLRDGKPSDTFSTPALGVLERPWVGGTTQDMLSRLEQDASLAGNSYWFRDGSSLVRMRPDWVDVIVAPRMLADGRGQIGWRKVGYVYTPNGGADGEDSVGLLADEVAHYAPIPDPLANYRGMSWLTPILREIQADHAMTRHQRKFFDNGATPNLVIKHADGATQEKVERWVEKFADNHQGIENAYKTLQIYPGADVTVVGSNLKDIDFKDVRGGGETRVAAAAGVPPVIVGLSEGLAAATYSNYGQARRRLADGTAHPLWQNMAATMENIIERPGNDVRLWYDADDVPFLREDEKDAAEIQKTRAATISSLITAGYTPESAVAAVNADDFRLLKHTGLYSVQLQEPGSENKPTTTPGAAPDTDDEEDSGDDDGA
ncbi:portal protein [Gordonia phage Neobush]|uniref:Portal protein n=9 Tax=Nymphadoravirus TaxID=2169636 RepID=A0A4Y5U0B6_9CAUD|nr:portal protein [Gordonia phage Kita]YP_010653038.1 portal protein [Gordonia phage Polly]YP_010653114.1 portal protein [Gordonia phage Maridalia]QCG77423.1 portal protein [Gordonia phage Antonio]QCW22408.1 portal protein [Gordonia phage Tayonia]QDF16485.1 portal protein [Gordonia phage Zameen]QDH48830.1 portal protein [Gordonia phage Suscepit]QUE26111.1 portal protein [Gordonia phage Trumpet]QUE26289.1 portal protein [Gordonia phage Neobush]UXE04808.1 portal protein [Gordonia phage Eudor